MVRITCVVGARPNFMKAAAVVRALTECGVRPTLVHTGQHYDPKMSELLFRQLGLPRPDVNLGVGPAPHGEQTGRMMIGLEPVFERERPDVVAVFGDVNSTVAASLCATKMGIKIAHVEAGLRSFDRTMPEEVNRVITDHLADYLFTTEASARANLLREGLDEARIFFVGNVMVDTLMTHREDSRKHSPLRELGLGAQSYGVLTLHRPGNVDDGDVLLEILAAVRDISEKLPIVFPCHPRTRQQLVKLGLPQVLAGATGANGVPPGRLIVMEPLGYLEFLSLMSEARLVLTDSGGIQEETTVLGVPCLTLRDNTERPVTVSQGTNVVVGRNRHRIVSEALNVLRGGARKAQIPELWDGKAAERIAAILSGVDTAEADLSLERGRHSA